MANGDRSDHGPLVYMATNLINGKRYIGITIGYLCHRKAKHYRRAETHTERGMPIARAIRKYGREMIRFRVLKKTKTYEDAKQEERRLIALLKPEYNLTAGGDGTEGYKFSKEKVRELANKRRGRPGPWRGKKLPDSFYAGRDRYNADHKAEWLARAALGSSAVSRPVVCIETNVVYKSSSSAGRELGISANQISATCRGAKYRISAGGLHFRYADSGPTEIITKKIYRGSEHAMATLTEDQVIKIFSLRGEKSSRELGIMFGVHKSTIKGIHAGRIWKHLGLKGSKDGTG